MKYYIIAGEASGDLHGSNLIKALKKTDPDPGFRVWGGDKMEAAGGILVKHYKHHAFMGLMPVLSNIATIRKNFRLAEKDILDYQPDALILVDYSGFNLHVAKRVQSKGFKIFYYISPQVWAWRKSRVHTIKKLIDRMFTILPFEKDFYKGYAVDVEYVGHPLLDAIQDFTSSFNSSRERFIEENDLTGKPIIALLPGSRKQEINAMLPLMLEATDHFPGHEFIIAGTSSLDPKLYGKFLGKRKIRMMVDKTYEILSFAVAALVTSGTATLETALFKVPQTVCYRAGYLSYLIVKNMVDIKYISSVNLIMDQPVIEELIQNRLNIRNLTFFLDKILNDTEYIQTQARLYDSLEKKLGGAGASTRAAEGMYRLLSGS